MKSFLLSLQSFSKKGSFSAQMIPSEKLGRKKIRRFVWGLGARHWMTLEKNQDLVYFIMNSIKIFYLQAVFETYSSL